MLALLVADDPRRSADRILTRLIQIHQAQGGAILRPSAGQVEIWMSAGLSLGAVSELPVRWADHREALEAGRAILEPGYALLPAMLGEELVAALYLAQPLGRAVADARLFGTAIAQAVTAANRVEGPSRVPELSPTEEARLQLLSLLERHEWNIAEVARLLSVTRRTVYMRLHSFGIERKRVPKIYKKMPVEG
ncbi:MAG TPA: helix-turn-helix domain-containing protein [Vicinamibacteria bacterium]|nr:helix-turn-helix domain-containing protein [Vicinamibacteria bacterium]